MTSKTSDDSVPVISVSNSQIEILRRNAFSQAVRFETLGNTKAMMRQQMFYSILTEILEFRNMTDNLAKELKNKEQDLKSDRDDEMFNAVAEGKTQLLDSIATTIGLFRRCLNPVRIIIETNESQR